MNEYGFRWTVGSAILPQDLQTCLLLLPLTVPFAFCSSSCYSLLLSAVVGAIAAILNISLSVKFKTNCVCVGWGGGGEAYPDPQPDLIVHVPNLKWPALDFPIVA